MPNCILGRVETSSRSDLKTSGISLSSFEAMIELDIEVLVVRKTESFKIERKMCCFTFVTLEGHTWTSRVERWDFLGYVGRSLSPMRENKGGRDDRPMIKWVQNVRYMRAIEGLRTCRRGRPMYSLAWSEEFEQMKNWVDIYQNSPQESGRNYHSLRGVLNYVVSGRYPELYSFRDRKHSLKTTVHARMYIQMWLYWSVEISWGRVPEEFI